MADIIQSRRHEYGEAARNAGGGKRAAPMCRGAPLSHLDRKIKRNGLSNQVRADFWQTSSNLAGTSTAKPHGMPESGVPEKYPKLLRSKRPEARERRVGLLRGIRAYSSVG